MSSSTPDTNHLQEAVKYARIPTFGDEPAQTIFGTDWWAYVCAARLVCLPDQGARPLKPKVLPIFFRNLLLESSPRIVTFTVDESHVDTTYTQKAIRHVLLAFGAPIPQPSHYFVDRALGDSVGVLQHRPTHTSQVLKYHVQRWTTAAVMTARPNSSSDWALVPDDVPGRIQKDDLAWRHEFLQGPSALKPGTAVQLTPVDIAKVGTADMCLPISSPHRIDGLLHLRAALLVDTASVNPEPVHSGLICPSWLDAAITLAEELAKAFYFLVSGCVSVDAFLHVFKRDFFIGRSPSMRGYDVEGSGIIVVENCEIIGVYVE